MVIENLFFNWIFEEMLILLAQLNIENGFVINRWLEFVDSWSNEREIFFEDEVSESYLVVEIVADPFFL